MAKSSRSVSADRDSATQVELTRRRLRVNRLERELDLLLGDLPRAVRDRLTMNAFKFGSDASRRAFFAKLKADKAAGGGGGKRLGGALTGGTARPAMEVLKGDPDLDTTEVEVKFKKEADELVRELVGRDLTHDEICALANAPAGSEVTVSRIGPSGQPKRILALYSKSERHDAIRFLSKVGGQLELENSSMDVFEQGTGLGTKLLARQVDAAAAIGVDLITTNAIGKGDGRNGPVDKDAVGYAVWPRLGYDAKLDAVRREGLVGDSSGPLAEAYANAQTIQDLFRLPGGLETWKIRGRGMYMQFDPTPGSRSRQVLDRYVEARFGGDE